MDERLPRRGINWCREPSPTVLRLRQYLEAGSVADVGTGDGENALYLARLGFDVLAVDGSPSAIAAVKAAATAERLRLRTEVCDLTEWKPRELFDGFLCHGVLHYLPRHEGLSLIRRIQVHTRSQGAVSLAARSPSVPMRPDMGPPVEHLYLPEELLSIFKGWEMIEAYEETVEAGIGPEAGALSVARLFAVRP